MKKTMLALFATMLMTTAHARDLGYDPHSDPFADYQAAIAKAIETDKLVLIIAGGDWCRWCHVLNRFVSKNQDVEQRLNDTFIIMKVYVGPENFNELFFSQLPQAYGAPHFWVISPEREVLASQSTGKLERGRSDYDKTSFLAFIDHWRSRTTQAQRHALLERESAPKSL